MPQLQEYIRNPIVLLVLGFGLFKFAQWAKAQIAEFLAYRRELAAALAKMAASEAELAVLLAKIADMPEKVMTGVTKACEAIAAETVKHRESVEQFGKLIFGKAKDQVESPSEHDRDRAYLEMAYRAQGHSPDSARDLAEIDQMKEASSYPSE